MQRCTNFKKKKKKTSSCLKILGATRRVTQRKFHTEGIEMLCTAIRNLVAQMNQQLGFVHHCIYVLIFMFKH